MSVARVVIDRAAPAYDREYDYLLPPSVEAKAGSRVLVPFGIKNEVRLALIVSLNDSLPNESMKTVLSLVDKEPVLNDEGLELLRFLHDTTFCMWFEGFRSLIVPGAGVKLAASLTAVRGGDPDGLSTDALSLYQYLLNKKKPTPEATALAAMGLTQESGALEELQKRGLVSRSRLLKKRIADERAVMARLKEPEGGERLTPKQRSVSDLLSQVGCASVKE
jgi:primosomal protein N' (replication factor Y)